eukprot:4200454-Amphidinium_carterae.1
MVITLSMHTIQPIWLCCPCRDAAPTQRKTNPDTNAQHQLVAHEVTVLVLRVLQEEVKMGVTGA